MSVRRSVASPERLPGMKIDGCKLVANAIMQHWPSRMFVLFSGGHDSAVLLSWARMTFARRLDAAVFIDTGTALPGVRRFVEDYCANRRIRLLVYSAGDEWERMTAEHGMPGPGAHRYPYVRLKERQIDRLIREHKRDRRDRIMLLTGVRASESERRMGTAVPVRRDGATVWVNPLIDWSDEEMRAFRAKHNLEESEASALMHRSGECNCGAFASPGEREELRSLYPAWFAQKIETAEARAIANGQPGRWGERRAESARTRRWRCAGALHNSRWSLRRDRPSAPKRSVGFAVEHDDRGASRWAPGGVWRLRRSRRGSRRYGATRNVLRRRGAFGAEGSVADDERTHGRSVWTLAGGADAVKLAPISIREANRYVLHHHRHHRPPRGALFALAAEHDGQLVGVAIVGRPVGRGLQDGRTVEVVRVATDGTRNACSFLYARCRRAAAALGYERVVTYTRQDESGASPRAAGFEQIALLPARSWADEYQADGGRHDQSMPAPRIRWEVAA